MVVVPSVIIFGTYIGSLLRKLSARASAQVLYQTQNVFLCSASVVIDYIYLVRRHVYVTLQVGRISTVAEEALSNIRTVRAFGMEDKECELLREEAMKAQDLNEQLGWGIGLFQVTFFENCFNLFADREIVQL